jgi:hypothetical protein
MARLYRIWEKGGIARKLRWLALLKIFGSPLKTPAEGSKGGVSHRGLAEGRRGEFFRRISHGVHRVSEGDCRGI